MRLLFLGTPEFACPALRALHAAGHEIACVVSQPDRRRDRGQKLSPSPVRHLARELGLTTRTLERGAREELYRELLQLDAEVAIVVAFGHLIREPLLHGPRLGCLNLHASLLPRWRGAAPVQRAILAGDCETGVCLMQLAPELDTGPIYACERVAIAEDESAVELTQRLAERGAALLVANLPRIVGGSLRATPQSTSGVSHAPALRKEEGSADLRRAATEIRERVRGLSPWPGVTLLHGPRRLKLLRVQVEAAPASAPGRLELRSPDLLLHCGQGLLRLLVVQPEGKAAMSGADYWRGAGARLGEQLTTLPDFQAPGAS